MDDSKFSYQSSLTQDSIYDGGGVSQKDAQSEATSFKPNAKERVYYVDWLRSASIILVIFVHALVNSFDASGLDPEDVPTIQQKKDGIIKCLVQIGIPMFFYISGIGATFFKTEEKNFAIFLGEKALRLLVPFIIAIFLFLIPRLYFGQQYEDFCRPDIPDGQCDEETRNEDGTCQPQIETDYWQFTAKTLPSVHLKLSWLWYLPALFIDFMLCYPLLRWTVRRSKRIPFNFITDIAIILHQFFILGLWAVGCYFLVTQDNYGRDKLVPAVITLAGVFFVMYTVQLLINIKGWYPLALWIKFLGPIGSICMNLWKTQKTERNLYHIFLMINYDAIFFSQGAIDMCYWRKMVRARKDCGNTFFAPLSVGIFIFLYSLFSPTNYSDFGHLFFYPLFAEYWLQCFYTSGTWLFVYTTVWLMAEFANSMFDGITYKYVGGAALYAYLSHYFYIIILAFLIVRPYQLEFIPALCVMLFGTFLLIAITYWPLAALYDCIWPPKETKPADTTAEDGSEGSKEKDKESEKQKGDEENPDEPDKDKE